MCQVYIKGSVYVYERAAILSLKDRQTDRLLRLSASTPSSHKDQNATMLEFLARMFDDAPVTGHLAQHEFDIAVSFAGEDREYVQEVVDAVKDTVRVFYDQDFEAEAWGEDGVEYFNDVYMNRARFAVIFVSGHYEAKMWTNVERKAALARAASQRGPYILPVQLDDTQLAGLLPTLIHLDARRLGITGIIDAIRAKVGSGGPGHDKPDLRKVPRTAAAIQAMIEERPRAWEYLLFAGAMVTKVDALEPKYRDHMIGFASRTGEVVDHLSIFDYAQAALSDGQHIAANFNAVLDEGVQEAAFGKPGEAGDPDRVLHMADRLVSVYEDFMDWAARLRGCTVNNEHARAAYNALAKSADYNVNSLRSFVRDFATDWDTMLDRLDAGEVIEMAITVTLDIDDEALEEYETELRLALRDN